MGGYLWDHFLAGCSSLLESCGHHEVGRQLENASTHHNSILLCFLLNRLALCEMSDIWKVAMTAD